MDGLIDAAFDVFAAEEGESRAVSYMLACIFRDLADLLRDQPPPHTAWTETRFAVRQATQDAIEWLDMGGPDSGLKRVVVNLGDGRANVAAIFGQQNSN